AKGFGKRISASPYLDEGSANVTVTAQLSGLKSRTRYYYRVCLLSVQGSAEGAVRSFMIGNLAPSGMGDVIDIIPGSTMALNVLANDSDPEGDKLSVASVTAVEPAAAGSVALVKNTVQFKSGDTPGECSFTYRV